MVRPRRKKPGLPFMILGVALLIGSIVVILASGEAMNEGNIRAQLERFGNFVSAGAQENGKEAKFSYDAPVISGWGHNKQAQVGNVSLAIWQKGLLDTSKWSASTAGMLVTQNPNRAGEFLFQFPDAINIIENSELKAAITAPSPIQYGFYEGAEQGKNVAIHTFYLPQPIVITQPQPAGAPAADAASVTISFDAAPQLEARMAGAERDLNYHFHNLHIASGDGSEIGVEDLVGKYHENKADATPEEGKPNEIKSTYSWALSNIITRENGHADAPYNLQAEMIYKGEAPSFDFKSFFPNLDGEATLEVTKMALTSADFSLNAQGLIATTKEDLLPFGSMDITVDHVGKFIASDLVPTPFKSTVALAVEKIIGHAPGAEESVKVHLQRMANGMFYIGSITFEELTATLLKAALMNAQQQPAAQQAAPIAPEAPTAAPAK